LPPGGGTRGVAAFACRPEQGDHRRVGEITRRGDDDGARPGVEGTRRHLVATLERARGALAVDPVERAGGALVIEASGYDDQIARRDEERVACRHLRATHHVHRAGRNLAGQKAVHAVVGEEHAAIFLHHALLQEAPHQHQGDEDAQGVEVSAASAREVRPQRAAVREEDSEGDRRVQVQDASLERLPRGAEKDRTADEHAQRRQREIDRFEEAIERALAQAAVDRHREDHRVHGDGGADSDARQELVRGRAVLLERGAERVPESLHVIDERAQRKVGVHREIELAQRRIDDDPHAAGVTFEEALEEPDAGCAMDALHVERDAPHRAARRRCLEHVEPFVVARARIGRDPVLAPQIVVAPKPLAANERIDPLTAAATKPLRFWDVGAAVQAGAPRGHDANARIQRGPRSLVLDVSVRAHNVRGRNSKLRAART
jgi:hypothetical protein